MNKRKYLVVLLILVFGLGCATLGVKPWGERTPKEKALVFLQAFNAQFADTMAMAKNPSLTETQKEIVRVKKIALKEIKPLIEAYDAIVVAGGVPSMELEQKILDYINRLVMLTEGGK